MRALAIVLALWAGSLQAVEPGEILDNPALEARAREISASLRCPVCRNESIDMSGSALAADLRVLVRERLVAGDSDAEVVAFMVERYGEFILLEPDGRGANLLLWLAAPGAFILALGVGVATIRRRPPQPDALSDEERARLDEIVGR